YNKPAQSAIVFDRLRNCRRRAGYKYRRSADGDAAAGHSFGGCRTSDTRASVRYTKPTEDESSSKSLDVLQRSRIHLYWNFKFRRRYKKFNNAPPDNITLHIQNHIQPKKVFLVISERYTEPTEDENSSDSLEVLQRSRIDLYLNCNSKKDKKISTTLHQII
ncbi:hypothetical protein V1477_001423, partial [Vespula maculifrons]